MRRFLIIFAAIITGTLLLHGSAAIIPDVDSFYHIRHAWLYRTEGIFDSALPWAQFSVVNTIGADLWYGFHILLIPLTLFSNMLTGIAIGGILITIATALLVYAALTRLRVRWPGFWLFVFVFATADLLYRITMLRPHPLSLGLSLLLFAFLVTHDEDAKKEKRTLWYIFAIGAAFSWIHISLSWLPVLIALAVAGFRVLQKIQPQWRKLIVLGAGLLTGILLRPNPFGAIRLAYIQVFKLLFEKQGGLPIRFGRELTPFVFENFADQLIPITILLAAGGGFLVWLMIKKRLPQEYKTALWGSALLALFFAYLTFGVARRSNEIFIGFAIIFLALLWTLRPRFSVWWGGAIGIVMVAALFYMPFKTLYRYNTYLQNAFYPYRFAEAAAWLQNNTAPQEIVFHSHWDRFAQLFYWNPNNYYINGMDPIFLFAHDQSLYWKTHFYAIDQAGPFTCGKIRCEAGETESTYNVLVNDFHASYVFVEPLRSSKLYQYLQSDERFEKVFDNSSEAIFRIAK